MKKNLPTTSLGPFFAFLFVRHHIHRLRLLFLSRARCRPHRSPLPLFWSCGCRCILRLRPRRRCVLPVFAVPAVSTPRTAAHGGGVLVAVVVFASPSLVPAPLPLSSDVALFVVVLIHHPPHEQVIIAVASLWVCHLGVSW
jgi:hypothetical protein